MIVLTRVDSRLVHGQVLEGWVPHLSVRRLVVADDQVAADPTASAAMAIASPPGLELEICPLAKADLTSAAADGVRTLVLVRDVLAAQTLHQRGALRGRLQLGNVHAGPGRSPRSRSVFLSEGEVQALEALAASGLTVDAQAAVGEPPIPLARLTAHA
ncbi:MAG: PTS sugar transporter subunit IIB [Myxococcaceae bacterium]|nr:PTS sugar transporter subunit IIB [Myxococcaceae bacterium]